MAEAVVIPEALPALTLEWAALHAALPAATPFTHPAWHETWLRHFGATTDPVFLAVRRDAQLIGMAALDLDGNVARQLGDHNVCDYAGLLSLPGNEPAIATAVIEWLQERSLRALELWGMPEDSPMRAAFATAATMLHWTTEETPEAVCPVAALPADFESYVAALRKHDRHEVRRKLRHLAAAGDVTFASATTPGDVAAGFERFLELMRMSRDDKDEFLTPAMEAFFRDLAQTFAALGMARLSALSLDGVAAAMVFAFENEGTTFLYNSGYDPAFAPLAAGLLSKVYAIRDSIERGKRSFDFLRGNEKYKQDLGGVPRAVVTLRLSQG